MGKENSPDKIKKRWNILQPNNHGSNKVNTYGKEKHFFKISASGPNEAM